jgi:transcriptional regulator with XRE-family HTH domain
MKFMTAKPRIPKRKRTTVAPMGGFGALALDAAIGERLRALRKERRVSLQALAAVTGVSIGYVSQVERGISTPSLKLLAHAADALGIGLAEFFGGGAADHGAAKFDGIVVRRGERGQLGLWQAGISKELLTPPRESSGLNLFLVRIEPGGTTGDEDYAHGGEEAGFVLEGVLELTVERHSWRLEPGDSFRFESKRPHRFCNPTGEVAVVLWVNATIGRA